MQKKDVEVDNAQILL
ncbi:MAG: hypothetical protein EZS28_040961, partial [Streblomastix strix]